MFRCDSASRSKTSFCGCHPTPDPTHAERAELELLSIESIQAKDHAIRGDLVHALQTLSLCSTLDHEGYQHLVVGCSLGHESGCFPDQLKVAG